MRFSLPVFWTILMVTTAPGRAQERPAAASKFLAGDWRAGWSGVAARADDAAQLGAPDGQRPLRFRWQEKARGKDSCHLGTRFSARTPIGRRAGVLAACRPAAGETPSRFDRRRRRGCRNERARPARLEPAGAGKMVLRGLAVPGQSRLGPLHAVGAWTGSGLVGCRFTPGRTRFRRPPGWRSDRFAS